MTNLANFRIRIWLLQSFSQRCRVEFQDASIPHNEGQIPVDSLPDAFHCPESDIGMLTLQPDEIKVAHNRRLQGVQHVILEIEIVLEKPLH